MATYRVAPKSYATGTGNGSSWTPGTNGPWTVKQLADAITAGTVVSGDRILFAGTHGTYGLNDASDFPSNKALNVGFASFDIGSVGGICFGNSGAKSSKASGVIFDGFGDGGQAFFDMDQTAAGVTTTNRMPAALSFRGESMKIIGFKVWPSTYNYVEANINTNTTDPEANSYENVCIQVHGCGNLIEYCDTDGHPTLTRNAFSRYGFALLHPTEPMGSSYSRNLQTIIRYNRFKGSFHSMRLDPGGPGTSGFQWRAGSELQVYENRFLAPCFGFRVGDTDLPYTAQTHGGHGSISGTFMGKSIFNDNYLSGDCQDGLDVIAQGIDICWNIVENIHSVNAIKWRWNGSAWVQDNVGSSRVGNGIKIGLSGYEGTYPSSWLGTDGANGGSANIKEWANRVIGNKIRNTSGMGITTNGSSGALIAFNEITDTELACIGNFGSSGAGNPNHALLNNYCRLAQTSVTFVGAVDVGANTTLLEYNNIYNAGPNASTRSAYDANYRGPGTRSGAKNVYVTGRRQLFSSYSYSGTNDVNSGNAQAINYVEGSGFPAGDVLEGVADMTYLPVIRTSGMTRDANKRRIWIPNNLGPYTRGSS